jgi:hypothetical protein
LRQWQLNQEAGLSDQQRLVATGWIGASWRIGISRGALSSVHRRARRGGKPAK